MMRDREKPDWERLESDRPRGEAYVTHVAFPELSDAVLAAIDSSGDRHFLISITPEDNFQLDNQSRGISVKIRELHLREEQNELSTSRYVDIKLKEESEKEIFDIIGYQIASLLKDQRTSRAISVRNVLARWRHFWGTVPSNFLAMDEIVGLFSELWFINHWILPFYSKDSLKGWRGPYGGRNDFEWNGISVEVKGTTASDGKKHWINGIDQLSEPDGGKLYFFSLKMREEDGANNTLVSQIRSCLDAISDYVDLQEFVERSLALAGYSPAHDDFYDKVRFRVVDEALYEVKDNFPRIIPSSFPGGQPDGIDRLEYLINLEGHSELIVSRQPRDGLLEIRI